jgi:hypothetical protein
MDRNRSDDESDADDLGRRGDLGEHDEPDDSRGRR